ncbi:MAG: hypothetical protein JXB14_07350 [Candidatus Altiarchaeota archaeon]|nr:hypothetical protein [Candidatus Altiarchaeota archaeon]
MARRMKRRSSRLDRRGLEYRMVTMSPERGAILAKPAIEKGRRHKVFRQFEGSKDSKSIKPDWIEHLKQRPKQATKLDAREIVQMDPKDGRYPGVQRDLQVKGLSIADLSEVTGEPKPPAMAREERGIRGEFLNRPTGVKYAVVHFPLTDRVFWSSTRRRVGKLDRRSRSGRR